MSAIQRYVYLTGKTPLGGQNVVNLNYLSLPFQVGVMVNIVSGNAIYGIDFTHDDISGDPLTFHWVNDLVNLPNGQIKSGMFLVDSPVTGLRLNLTGLTGEVRFSVIQGLGTSP